MDRKQLTMIAAGCGAAALIGSFLPWVSVSAKGLAAQLGAASASGGNVFDVGLGPLIFIAILVSAGLAIARFMGAEKSIPLKSGQITLLGLISFGLAAGLTLIKVFSGDFGDHAGGMLTVSRGIGLWLTFLGTAGGFAAWFLASKGGTKAASSD